MIERVRAHFHARRRPGTHFFERHEVGMRHAAFVVPDIPAAELANDKVVGCGEPQFAQHGQRILMDIAVAVIERDAHDPAATLTPYIRHDVAHGKPAITQAMQPAHLTAERAGVHGEAALWRALGPGLANLVIHPYGDHGPGGSDYSERSLLRNSNLV